MKEIKSNGLGNIISQAIEEMKSEQGDHFSLEKINLAELERRTGISRAKLRRFKENGFVFKPHALEGRKAPRTILTGYTAILDDLLRKGITNSSVCLERLRAVGFSGGLTPLRITLPPSASWWRHRAAVAVGSPLSREKLTKWTGGLPKW